MSLNKKLILVIFPVTTILVVLLSFIIRIINIVNLPLFSLIVIVLSLLISVIVYLSASAVIRSIIEKQGEEGIPKKKEQPPYNEKAVQGLALFQKKGRLVDFLQEDISGLDDRQIGAAVRNIHSGCREVLDEYVEIETVMKEKEGNNVTIEEGFDPSVIRLTGNVVGKPPFKGVLRHCGWRVIKTNLPGFPENQDLSIVEPAEVEII